MKLSKLQRTLLVRYQTFRAEPPTIGRLMSMSIVAYIGLLMATGAMLAIAIATDDKFFAALIVGGVAGALGRDIGIFIRFVRFWPVLNSIIDWNKADGLLNGESK